MREKKQNRLEIPAEIDFYDLPKDIIRDLHSLEKSNSITVGKLILMSTYLLEENPNLALEYALEAKETAGRIAVVRETVGIAAYRAGDYNLSLSELRAAKRISGNQEVLPLIADSLRALNKPEKAIEIFEDFNENKISKENLVELNLVVSGAWLDLGNTKLAILNLEALTKKPFFDKLDTFSKNRVFEFLSSLNKKNNNLIDEKFWKEKIENQ